MSTFDFIGAGIRSWLFQGMVTPASKDLPTTKKSQSINPPVSSNMSACSTRTGALLILLLSGVSTSAITEAVELPNPNVVFVCSHPPETGYLTKKALLESVRGIALLGDGWQGQEVHAPIRQSVIAAEQLVPSLPNSITDASAGVDGDGNVYFKLQKGSNLAYLTVEPAILHLLVMVPGEKNLYFDDVRFNRGELPSKILRALEQKMVG